MPSPRPPNPNHPESGIRIEIFELAGPPECSSGSKLLTFGESWHNNHHAFPTSAFHGLRRREFDPGGLFIRGLEQLGLAWDVVRVSPDRQLNKAIGRAA